LNIYRNEGCRHIFILCNTYLIPRTTMVTRTLTNIMWYVHCLYCCGFRWFCT